MKVPDGVQQLLDSYELAARMAPELEARKPYRKHAALYFALTFPYFLALSLLMRLVNLVSGLGTVRQRHSRFIRHYFRTFFKWLGIHYYLVKPLPSTLKPAIYFSVKQHPMESPFIYQLFDSPIIVPLHDLFAKYRAFRYFPSAYLGKMMSCIGYPQQPVAEGYSAIESMLDQGYSVVVMLNDITGDPKLQTQLYIQEDVLSLFGKSVDTYLLRATGFDEYDYGTPFHPLNIEVECLPVSTVTKGASVQTVKGITRVVDFFHYRSFQVGVKK